MDPADGDPVSPADGAPAFGALVEQHRPMLLRLVQRLLGDPAEAEDVAQEACLQAFLGLRRLRAPERFGAWLAGIGLNLARMRLRQRRTRPALEDWDGGRLAVGFTWSDATPTVEALCEARELRAAVLAAIRSLPPEQQAAVRAYYWDDLSVAEASRAAGVPPGTLKARLHRARRRLRTALADADGAPAMPAIDQETIMVEVIVERVVTRSGPPQDVLESDQREMPGAEAAPVREPLPIPIQQPRVVLLKERAGERLVPIWVGPWEGDMIALLHAGQTTPRPLTFELMARLLEAGQVQVERVAVTRLAEGVYYATVYLAGEGQPKEIDARPSDAITLALRLKVPILVHPAVLEEAALRNEWPGDDPGAWETWDAAAVMRPWPSPPAPPSSPA